MLAQLKEAFPDDVRVVYRHFPLIQIHDKATLATQASEAAGLQGMFWEYHDLLYQKQAEWSQLNVDQFQDWLISRAEELGLDKTQFSADLTSDELVNFADAAYQESVNFGIPGTPFILLNDRVYNGPLDIANMSAIIALVRLQEHQYTECPPVVIDPSKQYFATLATENGDIVIELLPGQAPIAVNNFVFLAREGWYDGVTFHRVLEGFMAQAGDPSGTGFGGPGYAFVNETSDLSFDSAGQVAMANAGPDSNGSQFFITYDAVAHLDGGYTIFGRVLEGQDVADSLTRRNPAENTSLPPGDVIIRVTIEEK